MEPRPSQAPPYRYVHFATATICGLSTLICWAASCITMLVSPKYTLGFAVFACLATASPFAALYGLSRLARWRLLPSCVTLLGAIVAGGLSTLVFSIWFSEAGMVLAGGTSRFGDGWNVQGIEFFVWPFWEWVFGMPVLLLLYGLGWFGGAEGRAFQINPAEPAAAADRPRE